MRSSSVLSQLCSRMWKKIGWCGSPFSNIRLSIPKNCCFINRITADRNFHFNSFVRALITLEFSNRIFSIHQILFFPPELPASGALQAAALWPLPLAVAARRRGAVLFMCMWFFFFVYYTFARRRKTLFYLDFRWLPQSASTYVQIIYYLFRHVLYMCVGCFNWILLNW